MPLTGAGEIGTGPFRAPLAALPDVPFVVRTPGGKAGDARDIATLKKLRAAGLPRWQRERWER